MIKYAADIDHVHHVSNILILKSVVHSAGVNHVLKLVPLFSHEPHPLNETSTFVLDDGHDVSVHVHIILDVELLHTLLLNIEHVTVGAAGGVASIIIFLLYHNEYCAHGVANVNVAGFIAVSVIVHASNTNAVVLA